MTNIPGLQTIYEKTSTTILKGEDVVGAMMKNLASRKRRTPGWEPDVFVN